MENKNLKGLFNLIRKESKDLRKKIEWLEKCVASLTVAVNELRGETVSSKEQDEISLGPDRREDLMRRSKEKSENYPEATFSKSLEARESVLLASLLKGSRNPDGSIIGLETDGGVLDGDSTDRRNFTPESSHVSVSCVDEVLSRSRKPASLSSPLQPKLEKNEAQKTQTEASQGTSATTGISISHDAEDHKRLNTLSSQIEDLQKGQFEILTILKDITERQITPQRTPVVVPPPRKVGRKVVGFVYEDVDYV